MTPFNPVIVTCLNNRTAVSEIILLCAARLNVPVCAAYTESNDLILLDSFDANTVWCENIPGKKWNEALRLAIEHPAKFTHFIIMGDDDCLSTDGFNLLREAREHHYVGFKDNGYYNLNDKRAMIHEYQYKCDKLIGAGRMISREAIMHCTFAETILMKREGIANYPKGSHATLNPDVAKYLKGYGYAAAEIDPAYVGLWPNNAKQSLDHHSELRLVMAGYTPLSVSDGRIHVTDFKSEVNIWPYSILENKCREAKAEDVCWFLSDSERSWLNCYGM
jgi:hypothetical protein